MNPELLALLCCPQDRTPLTLAPNELLARVEERRLANTLVDASGRLVTRAVTAGLLRADGRILYPVFDGIPELLADAAIAV